MKNLIANTYVGLFVLSLVLLESILVETHAQESSYKKRVLESAEVKLLSSYYEQDGKNAATTGGIGSEEITNGTGTIIISIPISVDEVITVDAGISAYTSASSSNTDPFDLPSGASQVGNGGDNSQEVVVNDADPFQASSGASYKDVWRSFGLTYAHSSDDRNHLVSFNANYSEEYDYRSFGLGGSYSALFNQKNTELSIKASMYLDDWTIIYPIEFTAFEKANLASGHEPHHAPLFDYLNITQRRRYQPKFDNNELNNTNRNSFAAGITGSQILSETVQGSLTADVIFQDGLLSTPFHRVYFKDKEPVYANPKNRPATSREAQKFRLADDIERLPGHRLKFALGARLNWYLNEYVVLRNFYRYYHDDWEVISHTLLLELPLKLFEKFTFYPSYRFYHQTAAAYFRAFNTALSREIYYSSDYDLSEFSANQFGFGFSYTDVFAENKLWRFGIKSIDIKAYKYDRNTSFGSYIISAGVKFVLDDTF